MNRNNLYNKLPINDINWHVVVENFPEGITEMELFDAIKSPYPPISIILENYCAIVTYNTVKEVILIYIFHYVLILNIDCVKNIKLI